MNSSQTDWDRIRSMKDEDIDFSDIPPITDEMFAKAFRFRGDQPIPTTNQTAVPIFDEVVEFFRKRHRLYPMEIDRVLRAYIAKEAMKEKPSTT